MGQAVHVMVYAGSADQGLEAAASALAELRRVEARLSLFDDASDLSELNRMAGRRPVRVGADLVDVLRCAGRLKRDTRGAFDPAIEPLMRAWGFRAPRTAPPSPGEIAEARAAVAAAEIRIDGGRVFLPVATTRLDLGGIGVGYGLDRAGALLRGAGIRSAFVDISGDCLAIGTPPGQAGWTVGIAAPGRHRLRRVVPLRDAALATSSNLASVVRLGDVCAGHVFDPATGHPAAARRQVSVIAASGILADALSTAALIAALPHCRRSAPV